MNTHFGRNIAVISGNDRVSYAELEREVKRMVLKCSRAGVHRGDRVGVIQNKSIGNIVTILACIDMEAVCVIMNDRYPSPYRARLIEQSKVSFVIGEDMEPARCNNVQEVVREALPADPILMTLFTSGSTGSSKAVSITRENLSARAASEIECFGLSESDRILNVLPFSFDVGLNQLLSTLQVGATLVLHNFVFPKDLLDLMKGEKITGVSGVPTVWRSLLQDKRDDAPPSSLRYLTISGGSMSVPDLVLLKKLFPATRLIKTYGQTETFRSAILCGIESERDLTSLGKPPPGVHVKIVRQDGAECCPDEIGELVHHGIGTMHGYFDDPAATAEKMRGQDGVRTGDLFSRDKDGFLTYHGRSDDMLKVRGHRVYLKEIERFLHLIAGVSQAVCIVEHAGSEPRIIAFTQGNASDEDIRRHCISSLPSHMVPGRIFSIPHMPLLPHGKIDRQALRTHAGLSL